MTAKNGPDRYRLIQRRLACVNERFEVFFDTIEQPDGSTIGDFLVVQPRVRHADRLATLFRLARSCPTRDLLRRASHSSWLRTRNQ